MLNPKEMKSGDILLHKQKYCTSSLLLLSELTALGTDSAFTADVFWLNKEYWFKEQNVILYQSEKWTKLC